METTQHIMNPEQGKTPAKALPLSERLRRPLAIGDRTIHGRLVLAPLSKLGNVAFRELVAGYGGFGLLFSEMSSSRAVGDGARVTVAGALWRPEERPYLVCQIFGDTPETMAAAARQVEAQGYFGVDINFGCSVAVVCRHGCGAELLKTPDRAVSIVAAVRAAVGIPVFVKYRTGWRDDPTLAVDLARRFADAGADALTFHPRVAPDRRTRPPRWEYIARVKSAATIPVFGNGDVFDQNDCERMLSETGCDGVALGRLPVARPWIFAEWTENRTPPPSIYRDAPLELIRLLKTHFEPTVAARRFNRFMAFYAANFKFGHTLYGRICAADTIDAAREVLENFLKTAPETVRRPNISLMR